MLRSLVAAEGACVTLSLPARDRHDALAGSFGAELDGSVDVLITCGGVSAGPRDLVPEVLRSLGVRPIFHKVAIKPGKPVWFGVGPERPGRPPALVFGLPGNPVSSLVGFLLFIRPALRILMGRPMMGPPRLPLDGVVQNDGDRTMLWPVRLEAGRAVLAAWGGSSNLQALAQVDGFVQLEGRPEPYSMGDVQPFFPIASPLD
jgi:molybdopterin molybdotransferase